MQDGLSKAILIVKFRQQLMGIAALNPSYASYRFRAAKK